MPLQGFFGLLPQGQIPSLNPDSVRVNSLTHTFVVNLSKWRSRRNLSLIY
ncbi:MAG: hypothetical protein AAGF77_14775 [Bacteroidota bacterium]